MQVVTNHDGSTDTIFNDGSTMTTRPARRERDPEGWKRAYHDALMEDMGDVEQTYRSAATAAMVAKAEREIVAAILAKSDEDPIGTRDRLLARIPSLMSTLDLIARSGDLAAKTIRECEAEAD